MSRLTRPLILAAAALALAAPAGAKPNGHNNGTGWGVGRIPPGHCKKIESCREGRVYRQDHDDYDHDEDHTDVTVINNYTILENPARYDLPQLPADQMYVRVDNDIYAIMRDTQTVVRAIGIISNLLN